MHAFKNTISHYGLGAILLHWIMAIVIIGQIFLGWYMNNLPISLLKLRLFFWHKEMGIVIFMLVTLRIIWRVINITPSLEELPVFEKIAARSVHWIFYFFMFAIPLDGWLMSSAKGLPVSFFGWFVIPDIIAPNKIWAYFLKEMHKWLAYSLLFFIILHIAAALKHHFINKDTILRRILP